MSDFSMGYFYSNEKGVLRKFTLENMTVEEEILDLENLETPDISAAYISEEVTSEDLLATLKEENSVYPISRDSNMDMKVFNDLKNGDAYIRTKKLIESWSLRNNLKLIENIYEEMIGLNKLIQKDWNLFMKEFWGLLRNTLGARELTIYFSDLDEDKKEGKKYKIVKKKAHGRRVCEFYDLEGVDNSILERYKNSYSKNLWYPHIDLKKGEIIGLGQIANCKIVWMGKIYGITPLQKSLLEGIFKALN